ncbi:MAG: WecB/TagA/CpsF family glycosyltransferase [Anaerolineales bacterium]|nr:WecB/TagA/CpsF family glycosyltransferase [Anaerolineales bacterium]
MKIAIDASRATRGQRTGTEQYARALIEALVTTHPEVQWTLFFRDDPGPWLAELGQVERVVLHAPRLWTYTALAPALMRRHFDAFWEPAHVLPPSAALHGIPSLVNVHDLGYEAFPEAHTAAQRFYLRATTRYHARAATHLVTISEATRRDLVARYGADPQRISVVYPGVDHQRFQPLTDPTAAPQIRARYSDGARYLLYVGTLQPRKNVARLVRAFGRITAQHPEVRLLLAGGAGWLDDGLQREIARTAQVQRLGYVPDDMLPALIASAEVLCFPSLFEGFGLPVLEAMACGTPVLTSNSSSLPEAAGDAALLVDPLDEAQIADGMARLLADAALRQQLRERGLAHAAAFTWQRSAAGIWQLLQRLIDETERQRHPDRITLLDLPIANLTWDGTVARLTAAVEAGQPTHVVTVNPEGLMRGREVVDYSDILQRAELVLPDGVGLLLAARLHGQRFHDRITGSDLVPRLAAEAAARGWRLYLLGAAPGIAKAAAAQLRAAHPTLEVIADGSDPAPDGPPELLQRIRDAAPHILLVAYGMPKQERWIDQWKGATGVPVQIGIGGALDFVARVVPRAPLRWQRLGLEWLWRLKEEPWRWRRMLALPRFVVAAMAERLQRRTER